MKSNLKKTWKLLIKNKYSFIVLIIFISELFLRFYQLDIKNTFGYDQVDNAWAAKNILVNHWFPLVGMVAKGNSGIYIGPLYYYLLAIFYFITNLDPIASGIFAGVTSIFTFFVIFYVTKKLFSIEVAIIAIFINTFFLPAILFDRVQWPVNFIPSISLLIFYVLYKITQGDVKKILALAVLAGISFSVHFTSIFFPILIILILPFFPKNKTTLKYILLSLPLFFVWLIPNIIYQIQQKSAGSNITSYLQTYYHGFHLKRVIQLAGDGLIQFNRYLFSEQLDNLKFFIFPAFFIVYLRKSISREKLIFCYMVLLWFVVPWFAFSTYSGEISDYYFSINRFIALIIISYLIFQIISFKSIIVKTGVIAILIAIAVINVINYLPYQDRGLKQQKEEMKISIFKNIKTGFHSGSPDSYLYYYFMRQKEINVY